MNDMQLALERLQRENDRLRREVDALQLRLAECMSELDERMSDRERRYPTPYLILTDRGDAAEGTHAIYYDTWEG